MEVRWQQRESGEKGELVRCGLCAHACRIPPGRTGRCGARRHVEGQGLVSPYLGRFSSIAVDPIEKKPLRHWQPGTFILSLGSLGCTMHCPFCQNHGIAHPTRDIALREVDPVSLLHAAREQRLTSVAYTYNEPTLQAEYILQAAPLLREAGIGTALVTNGMMSASALEELLPWLDALNVDVKTFNPATYARMGGNLDAVRRNVARLVSAGIHMELTCLVAPGISDDPEEFAAMTEWIAGLSPQIPLHVSRYFPAYRYKAPMTPVPLLRRFSDIARARLVRVHTANIA
jgi:pyruvate formate lyase activating enzyme